MIVPTRLALIWIAVGLSLGLVAAIDRRAVLIMLLLDAAVLGLVWWQGRRLRLSDVRAIRDWPSRLQVGREATMRLMIENHGERSVHVSARQAWPSDLHGEVAAWSAHIEPRQAAEFVVAVTPTRRGRIDLPNLEIDVSRRLSLAALRQTGSAGGDLLVLPNLRGITSYEKLRRSRALRSAGFHRRRMVGAGREFDRMREYVAGDDFREINWKATARSGEPRTNLYQSERSRDVVICVDGGRLMGQPVDSRTTLDHAIDAALLLMHAGHDQSDRVGLVTFRDRVETIIRPSTTNSAAILRCLAEFESQPVFPSYLALVEQLRARQTHRGLVFLLTDLNDPQLASDLVDLMPTLVSRHVVVVVSLRDACVEQIAEGPAGEHRGGVSRVLAARSIARERAERSRQLVKAGVQVLEADASQLTLAIINQYMDVKARQLL